MVAVVGILNMTRAIETIRETLSARGLTVRESRDFRRFEQTINEFPDKTVSEQFRLDQFELYKENAFWIGVYDQNKQCISALALRVENLGGRSLSSHWRDQQKRIYCKPNKIGKRHAPSAKRIQGKVCYGGDFVVHPDHMGRDSGSTVFMGFLMAALIFDADWIYGLMNEKLANSGFPNRCGFTVQEPSGTDWKQEPAGINGRDWLVATNRKNMLHRARLIADGVL